MPDKRRKRGPATAGRDSFADVPGLRVGHWTDPAAATGCTVILAPPGGVSASVSVRGGAPGTRETDVLQPGNTVQRVHAIVLTGGSAFGLSAAAGVMRYLEEQGIGFETRHGRVPIVTAAVLFDLGIGDAAVRPGENAGYAACLAATAAPVEGSVGAGTGATVAKAAGIERALKGGIGSAAERLADGTMVAALAAVNAYGDIRDPDSRAIVAAPRPGPDGAVETALALLQRRGSRPTAEFTNTTLVVVATTAALCRDQLLRVAEMGHGGIARAIEPSHSPADGDVVFAIATGEPAVSDGEADVLAIGALGARAVGRAIVRAVESATGLAGVPAVNELPQAGTGRDS